MGVFDDMKEEESGLLQGISGAAPVNPEETILRAVRETPEKHLERQAAPDPGMSEPTLLENATTLTGDLNEAPATRAWAMENNRLGLVWDDVGGLGEVEKRASAIGNILGFKNLTSAFRHGALTMELGRSGYELMQSGSPEAQERVEHLSSQAQQYEGLDYSWLEIAGQIVGGYASSAAAPTTAVTTLGGGLVGTAMGPVGTVAGLGAGVMSGMVADSMRVTAGHTYLEAIQEGLTRKTATTVAVGAGFASAALEGVGLGAVAKPFTRLLVARPELRSAMQRIMIDYGIGVGGESATEAAQAGVEKLAIQVGHFADTGKWDKLSPSDIAEAMADEFINAAKGMAILGIPGAGASKVRSSAHARAQKLEAEKTTEALDDFSEAIQETQTFERTQEVASEHGAEVLKQSGVEDVFVSVQDIEPALIALQVDPQQWYEEAGVADQVATAKLAGAPLRIAPANYVASVATSPHAKELNKHVRISPTAVSLAEVDAEIEQRDQLDREDELESELAANQAEQEALEAGATPEEAAAKPKRKKPEPLPDPDAQEVEAAMFLAGTEGFYKDAKSAGMTDKEYETYLAQREKAQLAALKRYKERTQREDIKAQEAALAEDRARFTKEESASLKKNPTYQLINRVETMLSQWEMKLSRDETAKAIAGSELPSLLRRVKNVMGRNIFKPPKRKGGVSPELVATLMGRDSASQMLYEISRALPFQNALEERVQGRLREAFPDQMDRLDESYSALEAIHTKEQEATLLTELQSIRKQAGLKPIRQRVMADAVANLLDDVPVRLIRPNYFLRAQERSSLKARTLLRQALASKEGPAASLMREATQAKFQQTINYMAANAAHTKTAQIARTEKRFRKLAKASKNVRSAIEQPYLDAIQAQLREIGFKTRRDVPPLEEAFATLHQSYNSAETPVDVQAARARDLKYGLWTEVDQVITALEKKGRALRKGNLQERIQELNEGIEAVTELIHKNLPVRTAGKTPAADKRSEARSEYNHMYLSPDTLMWRLDRDNPDQTAYHNMKGRIDKAMIGGYRPNQIGYIPRRQKVTEEVKSILAKLPKTWWKNEGQRREDLSGIGITQHLSKAEQLSAVLYSGTDDGYIAAVNQFGEEQFIALRERLSDEMLEYAQAVWDYQDSYWNEIKEAQVRRDGYAPPRAEAAPFTVRGKTYKGGFHRLHYSNIGRQNPEPKTITELKNEALTRNVSRSHTKRDHTKERKANVNRPLDLNPAVWISDVNALIYDLEVGDAAADNNAIINGITRSLRDQGHSSFADTLSEWSEDVLIGEIFNQHIATRFMRSARRNLAVLSLATNMATTAIQPSGIFASAVAIGFKHVSRAALQFARHPVRTRRAVMEASAFMTERTKLIERDLTNYIEEAALQGGKLNQIIGNQTIQDIRTGGFWPILQAQFNTVDIPTWIGAHNKHLEKAPEDAEGAIIAGDRAVRSTQGSSLFVDRPRTERGNLWGGRQSEGVRTWLMFTSAMTAFANVQYRATGRTDFKNPIQIMQWAGNMMALWMLPSMLMAALWGSIPEDDDWQAWAAWGAGRFALGMAAGFPLAREMAATLDGFSHTAVGGATTVIKRFIDQAQQGEADAALARSASDLIGFATGMPTKQLMRSYQGAEALLGGDEDNPLALITGPRDRFH